MKPAFLDTSFLVAIVFGEPGAGRLKAILRRYDTLFASELLLAEFMSVAQREGIALETATSALDAVSWLLPDRSIRPEIERVLKAGHLRGADLWHLACACYLAPRPKELAFLTRDQRQRQMAAVLGFPTP